MKRTALGVLAMLVLGACGSDGTAEGPTPTTPLSPVDRLSSTAELTIASPETGDLIRDSTVDLRVELEGARIVPQTTTDVSPDEGHLHVWLDDDLISMTEGLEQAIPDVAPGPHRVMVEFVASDHRPFDPRVVTVVAFEVAR